MKRIAKKYISVAMAAVMLILISMGNVSLASAEADLGVLGTYEGERKNIQNFKRGTYFDKGSVFEVKFRYDVVDKNAALYGRGFNNTLQYRVFDTGWNGWQTTYVGPNGYDQTGTVALPQSGDTHTIYIPINAIESKYTGTKDIYGINLQTGDIGNSKITILSQKILGDVVCEGAEFTATGSWKKFSGGNMRLDSSSSGKAVLRPDAWNIEVCQFSVNGFTNPTVDVTVNYPDVIDGYVQAEILVDGKPVIENYVIPGKAGTMTYTTELPLGTTSFLVCYDECKVTKIHVYDNTEEEPSEVTGKSAEVINQNMNPCWNLGNALDSFDPYTGNDVGERLWGNPVVTQKIFQQVKKAGFRSVRIPVSYLNKVDENGEIDEDYLARIKKVVSMAKNSGLYVIINTQYDGGDGVPGQWIDISQTGNNLKNIKKKFTKMWQQIAYAFQDVDQHLVFESMNEVKVSGETDAKIQAAYKNINALNQAFVDAVRSMGGYSPERCLIIPGYNEEIDLTAKNYGTEKGFQVPVDSKPNKLILSVHFFEPYDFTKNPDSSKTTCTMAELRAIRTQFEKIKNVTNLPVFVGAYGAVDKDNVYDRADYLNRVRYEASRLDITLAYWDNGNYGHMGPDAFAIFDRLRNEVVEDGEILISAIMGTYE